MVLGGTHWLNLTPLFGPLVQMANVSGFDELQSRIMNLPMVALIAMVQLETLEWVILRVKRGIFNEKSNHTLGFTCAMQSMGILVDDVHKDHPKDCDGGQGTQCIEFLEQEAKILVVLRGSSMTFTLKKPTLVQH